jgi:hypothetical protein
VSFVSNNVQTLRRAIEGKPEPVAQPVAPPPGDDEDDQPASAAAKRNGAGDGATTH